MTVGLLHSIRLRNGCAYSPLEQQPVCEKCLKSHSACHYNVRLVWKDESSKRGICHGREGVWSKKGKGPTKGTPAGDDVPTRFPVQNALHFVNTTYDDMILYHGSDSSDTSLNLDEHEGTVVELDSEGYEITAAEDVHNGPVPKALSLVPVSRRHDGDSMLLSYFESVICSSSTFLDDWSNPYRHVLLPMALQSQGLFHATLAISANTLRLTSPTYAVIALEHQREALKHLIRLINAENKDTKTLDEILGLVLMLCWFDISDGCRPSWIKHLRGFRGLLAQHQHVVRTDGFHARGLERFFTQYFLFHLVLAKTTFHAEDTSLGNDTLVNKAKGEAIQYDSHPARLGSTSTLSLGRVKPEQVSPSTLLMSLYLSHDALDEVDLYMGFSNALLLLLNEIAELHTSISEFRSTTTIENQHPMLVRARRIKRSLDKLIQQPPPLHGIPEIEQKRLAILAIAETYRIGALLFLHEVLNSAGTATLANRLFRHSDRASYISSILGLVDANKSGLVHMAILPLWPLFIAGCCADAESDRLKTIEIFELMENQHRFGNIAPAHQVVEMTWRQRDLSRDQVPVPTTTHLFSNATPNVTGAQVEPNSSRTPKRPESVPSKYEWERILDMLGGWRISLT